MQIVKVFFKHEDHRNGQEIGPMTLITKSGVEIPHRGGAWVAMRDAEVLAALLSVELEIF